MRCCKRQQRKAFTFNKVIISFKATLIIKNLISKMFATATSFRYLDKMSNVSFQCSKLMQKFLSVERWNSRMRNFSNREWRLYMFDYNAKNVPEQALESSLRVNIKLKHMVIKCGVYYAGTEFPSCLFCDKMHWGRCSASWHHLFYLNSIHRHANFDFLFDVYSRFCSALSWVA